MCSWTHLSTDKDLLKSRNWWKADIYRSFVNLNGISMNLNELENEVTIPANQISEYMDSAHKFFRLIPGLLEAIDRIERRSLNIER